MSTNNSPFNKIIKFVEDEGNKALSNWKRFEITELKDNGRDLTTQIDQELTPQQIAIDYFGLQKEDSRKLEQAGLLAELYNTFYRVRQLGSGTLSLAWMAQGMFGGYLKWRFPKEKFSDIAAGLLIVKQAGYKVTLLEYSDKYLTAIVGHTKTYNKLVEICKSHEIVNRYDL
jgi:fructose-1,6-bisphosphatase/inositol monophosphatase family enzyme